MKVVGWERLYCIYVQYMAKYNSIVGGILKSVKPTVEVHLKSSQRDHYTKVNRVLHYLVWNFILETSYSTRAIGSIIAICSVKLTYLH